MISITLTVNDPDAARVAAAFGKKLGLAIPATEEDVKNDMVKYVQQVTLQQEQVALVQDATQAGAQIVPVAVS
jgi:hypothetical protein